jgi:hypothetical protein
MGTTIPVEERLGISSKTQMTLPPASFCVPKKLYHVDFCFVAVSLPRGVKGLLFCQSVIPQVATFEK